MIPRASIRCAALVAAAVLALPARADEPGPREVEEARKHYQRGVQLYEQGADAAALAELERAYALVPSWKVLYDIALVEQQMHDFAGALRAFQRYLDEGKGAVLPARRAEVERRLAELREEVASLEVIAPAGAEITIDDIAVGVAPLSEAVVLNPGRHKIGASKEGRVAEGQMVNVAGGDRAGVELAIPEPQPAAAPPPPPPLFVPLPPPTPPAEAAPSEPRSYVWLGWVATGALATGAVVSGLEALSANSDLTHAKEDHATPSAQLEALSSRAHDWALASDLLSAATLGVAGTTLYFTLRGAKAPSSPQVAVAPSGVLVSGVF